MKVLFIFGIVCAAILIPGAMQAQESAPAVQNAELHLRLASEHAERHNAKPAVVWLESQAGTQSPPFTPHQRYTLLQKNRMFVPHLQVVPVGSAVQFPNADPFFHNVFSLFDGKRFDLGLYEAGSSKTVTFSREGVSYIFCNIHPEMSAVVLTLSTPLYEIGDANSAFVLRNVPLGDYRLHLWIEGATPASLNNLSRLIHVSSHVVDLGEFKIPNVDNDLTHTDEYGHPYHPTSKSAY